MVNVPVLTYKKKKGQPTEMSGNQKLEMVNPREEKDYKKVKLCVTKLVQVTKLQKLLKTIHFK